MHAYHRPHDAPGSGRADDDAKARLIGRFKETLAAMGRAVAIWPSPEHDLLVDCFLRRALQKAAQLKEARQLYRALSEASPRDARAASNLAVAVYCFDDADAAIRSFERALALDPTLEMARTGLATVRSAASTTEHCPQ